MDVCAVISRTRVHRPGRLRDIVLWTGVELAAAIRTQVVSCVEVMTAQSGQLNEALLYNGAERLHVGGSAAARKAAFSEERRNEEYVHLADVVQDQVRLVRRCESSHPCFVALHKGRRRRGTRSCSIRHRASVRPI